MRGHARLAGIVDLFVGRVASAVIFNEPAIDFSSGSTVRRRS